MRYCNKCHKSMPDDHLALHPDHAIAKKRAPAASPQDAPGATPPRAAAPRAPRVAPTRAPEVAQANATPEGEGEESKAVTWGLLGVGAAVLGFVGWAIWQGGRNSGAA